MARFDAAAKRVGIDVGARDVDRRRILKAAGVMGSTTPHPLMMSPADRRREQAWLSKLRGFIAIARTVPPRVCLCGGYVRRADLRLMNRGAAADIPQTRVAATPRLGRGHSVGDESRRRRGRDVDILSRPVRAVGTTSAR